MEAKSGPQAGVNAWLEEELMQQYRHDRTSVDPDWKQIFEHNGSNGGPSNGAVLTNGGTNGGANGHLAAPVTALSPRPPATIETSGSEELMPLRGAAARIAENMAASVSIPLATSQRIIPVKVIDENRRLINHHRSLVGKSKVSYTHLIGWAIVKSVRRTRRLNHAFAEQLGRTLSGAEKRNQFRSRGRCGGQERRPQSRRAEHQKCGRDELSAIHGRL